jgi:LysM repeat protein
MKGRAIRVVVITSLILFLFSSSLLANQVGFQNYKIAVKSLEARDWEQARNHLDEVILNDLANSEFTAKAVYLKTILLAAEINRDLELKNHFKEGKNRLQVTQEDRREEFELKIKNYQQTVERKIDTLIGLTNYLVANTPPLDIKLDYLHNPSSYDQDLISNIKAGQVPTEDELSQLETDLLSREVNNYLQLTLDVKGFNNLSTIQARSGDTIYDLAQEYEIPFYLMLNANTHIENPDEIYPGEKIYLPKLSSAHVSYPAYFYYLSRLAYSGNSGRKEDITRLVEKAYQLTNAEDKTTDEYIKGETDQLSEEMKLERYREQVAEQEERIKKQQEDLQELQDKYQQLLTELDKVTEEEESQPSEEDSGGFLEEETEDYNPEKDPMDY